MSSEIAAPETDPITPASGSEFKQTVDCDSGLEQSVESETIENPEKDPILYNTPDASDSEHVIFVVKKKHRRVFPKSFDLLTTEDKEELAKRLFDRNLKRRLKTKEKQREKPVVESVEETKSN